jgi:hypothetical protein
VNVILPGKTLNAVGRSQMRYLRSLIESKPILGRTGPVYSVSDGGPDNDHMQATGPRIEALRVYIPPAASPPST